MAAAGMGRGGAGSSRRRCCALPPLLLLLTPPPFTCWTPPPTPPHPLQQELRQLPAEARPDAERRAKQRLLGTIRLISELFNKDQVNDRIMLLILSELLGAPDNDPSEENVEVGG